MKRNKKTATAILILAAILTGCDGAGTGGVTAFIQTEERTWTPWSTYTRTQTHTPTITPTATKVPDLEIFSSRIVDLSNTIGGVYFMGRIRNNTDITMILPAREYAFTFNFEEYDIFYDVFRHFIYGPYGVKPGIFEQGGPRSNCILYPKEEGVYFFSWSQMDKLEDYSLSKEELKDYDGPLGLTYTYTSNYTASPDLPDIYHPKAENITFQTTETSISFEYDINVPAPEDRNHEKGMVMGFLMMYDSLGEIINVLYANIYVDLPWEHPFNNMVHMYGTSPYSETNRWSRFMEITKEDLERVDHVEMLFEVQYEGICFDKRYPKTK